MGKILQTQMLEKIPGSTEASCQSTVLEFCDFIKTFLDNMTVGGHGMHTKDDNYKGIIHIFYFLHKLFLYMSQKEQ